MIPKNNSDETPICSIRHFLLSNDDEIIKVDNHFIKWLGFNDIQDFMDLVQAIGKCYILGANDQCQMSRKDLLDLVNNLNTPKGADILQLISTIDFHMNVLDAALSRISC